MKSNRSTINVQVISWFEKISNTMNNGALNADEETKQPE